MPNTICSIANPQPRWFSRQAAHIGGYVSTRRSSLRRQPDAADQLAWGLRGGVLAASGYRAVAKHVVGRGPRVPAYGEGGLAAGSGPNGSYDAFKEQGLVGMGLRQLGAGLGWGEPQGPVGSQPVDDLTAAVRLCLLTVPEAALIGAGLGVALGWEAAKGISVALWALATVGRRGVELVRSAA